MTSATLTVVNETGLHTRPGTQFVQLAQKFASDITLKKADKEANAKSIIKVMKIGISKGDEITIEASGADEKEAIDSLAEFVKNLTE
ncbi:MAG: HPr family phosphocarrier protein [Treponema sp.]|nr:HPr family phosphocarrier protein [Treponema sp.]